jgi:hypothetical protein
VVFGLDDAVCCAAFTRDVALSEKLVTGDFAGAEGVSLQVDKFAAFVFHGESRVSWRVCCFSLVAGVHLVVKMVGVEESRRNSFPTKASITNSHWLVALAEVSGVVSKY